VAFAESGGRPEAVNRNTNGSTDHGLWQINTIHGSLLNQGNRNNPADNAKMAYTVWQRAGGKWTPWATYNSQKYRAFLPQATLAAGNPTLPTTTTQPTPQTPAGTGATPVGGATEPTGTVDPAAAQSAGILDTLGSLAKSFGAIPKIIGTLLSGGLWLRVGAFIAGGILIMFSIVRLSGAENAIKAGVKMAVTKGAIK
jgi:Lysozyme like domain